MTDSHSNVPHSTALMSLELEEDIGRFIFSGAEIAHTARFFADRIKAEDDQRTIKPKGKEKNNYYRCREAHLRFAKRRNREAYEMLASEDVVAGCKDIQYTTLQGEKHLFLTTEEMDKPEYLHELKELGLEKLTKIIEQCQQKMAVSLNCVKKLKSIRLEHQRRYAIEQGLMEEGDDITAIPLELRKLAEDSETDFRTAKQQVVEFAKNIKMKKLNATAAQKSIRDDAAIKHRERMKSMPKPDPNRAPLIPRATKAPNDYGIKETHHKDSMAKFRVAADSRKKKLMKEMGVHTDIESHLALSSLNEHNQASIFGD